MSATNPDDVLYHEHYFRRLYEEAPLPYQSLDNEARLIEVNQAWENTFGYTRDEVLGRFIGDFHVPGQEEKLGQSFNEFLSRDSVSGIELEFCCKDGTRKLMSVSGRIARDSQGRFLRTHCILNDITERKIIEKALQESEYKYRLAMEATQDGLWDWDVTTGDVYYSPSWGRILGEKAILNNYSTWEDRIHPKDKPRILMTLRSHLAGETAAWQEEHRLRNIDGAWIWVLGRGRVVTRDREGNPLRMVGTMTDINTRKQAEKSLRSSEERLKALINAATDDVVVLLDSNFNMEIVNERAARGFGSTVELATGQPLEAFMPLSIASKRLEHAQEVIESGQAVRFEDHRAGHWFDNNFCPVFDDEGNPQAVAIFARDITERKKLEQTLAEAKEAAEKANRAKSRFLSTVNHDLRQPLHAIKLLLNTLSHYRLDPLANAVVEDMNGTMQSMEELLNALLDISKLEAGNLTPEKTNFHFAAFMQQLQHQFKATAEEAGIIIRMYPSDVILYTDPVLLARILQNFIANAIQHTRSNHVLVGCRRAGNHRRIEVWDTGSGIPADQRDKIFEEFYQIGNTARDANQGLGLGLAIAKRIADLLELRIEIRSTPGKGSVFAVEVPLGVASEQSPEERTAATTTPIHHRCVILVIDDDQAVLHATKTLLNAYGHDAIGASCAEEALSMANQHRNEIDLVLMDYRLPNGWNGIRLIESIRTAIDWELPAVMVTGDTSINSLQELEMSGIALFHKPFDPSEFRLLLEQVMQNKESAS
jgi:two-component system, sensor histidine kinase